MELNRERRLRLELLMPLVEVATLLGVREVLDVSDLVVSALFNESVDAESIVLGLVVFGSGIHGREVDDDFSRCLNHFVENEVQIGKRSQNVLALMEVVLSSVGVIRALWEHLIGEILCEMGFDVAGVLSEIAVEKGLDGLQLGSGSVEAGHFGHWFMMVLMMVSVGRG